MSHVAGLHQGDVIIDGAQGSGQPTMPLPRLHIEDPDRGLPRQPVPVRYAYLITGLTPAEFLSLLATRQEGRYEYLTAYEFVQDAEPRKVRPACYQAIVDERRGKDPDHEALIEQLPTSHFVWSNELAGAFSQFIRDYLDDETANQEGMGLVWNPALGGADGLLSECVDLSALAEGAKTPEHPDQAYLFRRSRAGGWEITFEGRSCGPFKDSLGLNYIKQLLQNQHRTVSAIELSAVVHQPMRSDSEEARRVTAETFVATESEAEYEIEGHDELSIIYGGHVDDAIDPTAMHQYQARLRKLKRSLDIAEETANAGEATSIRQEMNALQQELQASTRPTGDRRRPRIPRRVKATSKRAYDAVDKNIGRAITLLKQFCPDLGQHLDDHVKYFRADGWRYQPPTKINWHF